MKKLLIVGAGGHGRSVAEAVLACKEYQLVGFIDDNLQTEKVWNYPVFGNTKDFTAYLDFATYAIVAIGNNFLREKLLDDLIACGFQMATVIHPSAVISPTAIIGGASTIMAGAIVGTEAQIGCGVIVNSGATIDHHCVIEDYGHLGVNASMAGGARLGKLAWLHPGTALGYGVATDAEVKIYPAKNVSS